MKLNAGDGLRDLNVIILSKNILTSSNHKLSDNNRKKPGLQRTFYHH